MLKYIVCSKTLLKNKDSTKSYGKELRFEILRTTFINQGACTK